MSEIQLSATGFTVEELYQESESQFAMLTNLGKLVDKLGTWVSQASSDEERARLWDEYAGLCRDYTVLTSWYQVTYAAYIFAQSGSELSRVTPESLAFAHAVLSDE